MARAPRPLTGAEAGAAAIWLSAPDPAQRRLEAAIARIAAGVSGTVGVAVLHVETGRAASVNGTLRFPMASTAKIAVAIQILTLVERGALGLDQVVALVPGDWHPGSGIISRRPPASGDARSIRDLLELLLVVSDNSASDVLLRLAGGPDAVTRRLRALGHADVSVDRSMIQVFADLAGVGDLPDGAPITPRVWAALRAAVPRPRRRAARRAFLADSRDTTTPDAMARLLASTFRGEILAPEPTRLLLDVMSRCAGGSLPKRLPAGTRVAHKTGTLRRGVLHPLATNDVGIVDLPPGAGHVAIAAFVLGSPRMGPLQRRAIARIARAVHDHFATGTPG